MQFFRVPKSPDVRLTTHSAELKISDAAHLPRTGLSVLMNQVSVLYQAAGVRGLQVELNQARQMC